MQGVGMLAVLFGEVLLVFLDGNIEPLLETRRPSFKGYSSG